MKVGFRQQTSFIERLRIILLIIAAFFILGIMGLYLSSRGFLVGLQEITQANRVLSETNITLQAHATSLEHLQKLETGVTPGRMEPFLEASRIAMSHLRLAITDSKNYPGVQDNLKKAHQNLEQFRASVANLRSDNNRKLDEEILVAREFALDAEENIREAQITLKKASDNTFQDIYEHRFNPLIVAGLLSSAFFAFVVIVGFSNARRLRLSLGNLTQATDAVSAGDLSHEAPIIEKDEFGKLTYEFNDMVSTLRDKQHRLNDTMEKVTRLQSITNSFSGTLLPEDVFAVIAQDVYRSLKADVGSMVLLTDDRTELESRVFGYSGHFPFRFSADFPSPVTKTVKEGSPYFFSNVEDLKEEYPAVYDFLLKNSIVSNAYLPLMVGNQIYGALNFGFRITRYFTHEEREFMMALTRQCAQALHRAKLFQSANDAIRVRDEFLSIASHELRTPLTPLKLQLQNVSRQMRKGALQMENNEQVLKIFDSSDRQVDRLIALIDDLLDVSRISAGKLTLNFETFNLGEMTEDVLNHYSGQLREAQSELVAEVDRTLVCKADRVRIEQVLINLLTNASKYAPKKPVHVTLKEDAGFAVLTVRDEGQGISYENQKRIFERFERVKDKNNIGGLGLGLYICRQIIEAHGGTISVESEPGEGSCFKVKIPLVS